jgi:hypothetical protein
VDQVIQVIGALLILGAFAANQRGGISADSELYLGLNLVGSAILCVLAISSGQIGFVLLEGVWAIVSGWGLIVVRSEAPRH